ncbi:MAG: hypothetical protein MUO58_19470 [Anaerolineales bacterium]|nr:hypothetical protein [Anaerolineales bacterium]
MDINRKIAKIPFDVLYAILALLVSFNWLSVILFQKNFSVFESEQPWDYYLASIASRLFGIEHRQYYVFALPIVLIVIYGVLKLTGWLIGLDKKTEIKGDNHTAIIAILLVLPVSLGVHKLLGPGWRNNLLPGVVLIIAFSIWTGIAESKAKKAKFRKELT